MAAYLLRCRLLGYQGFNTQQPEGGCLAQQAMQLAFGVSTHSNPKVAARQPTLRKFN